MAAAAVTTSKIILPKEVAKGIVAKSRNTSVIQTLSPSSPMLFKDVSHILFTKEPEAEFVEEGGSKSGMDIEGSSPRMRGALLARRPTGSRPSRGRCARRQT